MVSSKASRQPPARIFENYVLVRVAAPGIGLTNISDSAFTSIDGGVVSDRTADDDSITTLAPIGFDFEFDGTTYKRMCVSANGWLALAYPTATSSSQIETIFFNSASFKNEGIKSSIVSSSVLLCPWFDDLRNVAGDIDYANGGGSFSTTQKNRYINGIDPPPLTFNQTDYAVKVFYDNASTRGRRTVVRWNSMSDYANASTRLKFEVVIYENGTIEYRYAPRKHLTLAETTGSLGEFIEDATVGIFVSGTNRFRDFSLGLGYIENRNEHKYGGCAFDASFSDSGYDGGAGTFMSRPYVWRLRPAAHWPGLHDVGGMFVFKQPQNRRKVLPKQKSKALESLQTYPRRAALSSTDKRYNGFDDRRSIPFVSGVVVNYPTTLPRFFGNSESSVIDRQDLFLGSGDDFNVTGSVISSLVDQFIEKSNNDESVCFNEALHTMPEVTASIFFASGSDFLSQPTTSKAKLKFSLRVNNDTVLFGTSASIYCYNVEHKTWLLPQNSVDATQSDIASPTSFVATKRVLEDHKGFGPIGNFVASGSSTPSGQTGSDVVINSSFNRETMTSTLSKTYSNSVTLNSKYAGDTTEVFSLSIEKSFLIEKAIIEIPIAAGSGWFNDKTTSFLPLSTTSGSFDFAGPACTVALFNQVTVNNTTRRDLILTGTFTHADDNVKTVVLSNFPPITTDYQLRPVGFLSYATNPGAVVTPVSQQFTGSIQIKCEALSSNGLVLRHSRDMTTATSASNIQELTALVSSPTIVVHSGSGDLSQGFNVAYVNPFGRSCVGTDPSGRSVYGREFGNTFRETIDNPFYLTGSARTQLLTQAQSAQSGAMFHAVAAVPIMSHFSSPYLLNPGDKLLLTISKSRPYLYSTGVNGPAFSGSTAHDLVLKAGNINVTLFGSVVRADKETSEINKELTFTSVHDSIENEITDQYDVVYQDEYVGNSNDDYVTGSMVTFDDSKQSKISTGSRGRVFSKFNARTQSSPDESAAERANNPSKSFRLQPWFERANTPRIVTHVDTTERFYDSLMPSISDCIAKNGASIVLKTGQTFGNDRKVVSGSTYGFMFLNPIAPTLSGALSVVGDKRWTWSYPFEPNYSNVSRQKDLSKSFIATKAVVTTVISPGVFQLSVSSIEPSLVRGFFITDVAQPSLDWLSDVNLTAVNGNGFYPTGSMDKTEITRALFGIGDKKIAYSPDDVSFYLGANNFPKSREAVFEFDDATETIGATFLFGQVIRGWKYGVHNGNPEYTKAIFRRNRFGQVRDMLEQRPVIKSFQGGFNTVGTSPIQVKFLDAFGKTTTPENTFSQNLSNEATSSIPYFDGVARNRPAINTNTLNTNVIVSSADAFGNILL